MVARALFLAGVVPLAGCFNLSRIHGVGEAMESPSCQAQSNGTPLRGALARTCGPDGNDSCCASDFVDTDLDARRGEFNRSFDGASDTQDGMAVWGWQARGKAAARVSPFYLDRYEVTVGRFKALYNQYDIWLKDNPLPADGAGAHSRSAAGGWHQYWKDNPNLYAVNQRQLDAYLSNPLLCDPSVKRWLQSSDTADDNRPMTCINWYEAYLFCIFDDGRLPTEAEWNFAAAGGSEQRVYPWSGDNLTESDDLANVGAPNGKFLLRPVGSLPRGKGRYGQFDLAGNALEWVHDRCGDCSRYATNNVDDPIEMEGPADSMPFTNMVGRGGSYRFPWYAARTAYRQQESNDIMARHSDSGWRCAHNGP